MYANVYTDNFFRIWIAVSILKISNICNINSKLAIEFENLKKRYTSSACLGDY